MPLHQLRYEQALNDGPVDKLAAQVVVSLMINYLDHSVTYLDHRRVEGTAAKIVDQPKRILVSVLETIGESGGGRFRYERAEVDTGQLRGPSGGIALWQFEGRRYSNHCRSDIFGQMLSDISLERLEHLSRKTLRFQRSPISRKNILGVGAHLQFEFGVGILGLALQSILGATAHNESFVFVYKDRGRSVFLTFIVFNKVDFCPFQQRYGAVSGPQINAEINGHPVHMFVS